MLVRHDFAGWLGVALNGKITSGVSVWDLTKRVQEQIRPCTPKIGELKTLRKDLIELNKRVIADEFLQFVEDEIAKR